jgi:membrane-associated protease RseP (regulator of RpoE activity)
VHLDIDGHLRDKPLAPGERRFVFVFLALVLGGFAVELLRDFDRTKLTFFFFVLAWIVLVPVHEAGHALAGRLCGWRVRRVGIGLGPVVKRLHVRGVPVEIRAVPLVGFVSTQPTTLHRARLSQALVYAGGPGIELLVAAAIGAVVGFDVLLAPSRSVGVLAAQSVALAAAVGAGLNLIPFVNREGQPSDGMGLLMSPFQTRRYFLAQIAAPELEAAARQLARGDAAGALGLYDAALEKHPDVVLLHIGRAFAIAALGSKLEGMLALQAKLRSDDLEPDERRQLEAALAHLRAA